MFIALLDDSEARVPTDPKYGVAIQPLEGRGDGSQRKIVIYQNMKDGKIDQSFISSISNGLVILSRKYLMMSDLQRFLKILLLLRKANKILVQSFGKSTKQIRIMCCSSVKSKKVSSQSPRDIKTCWEHVLSVVFVFQ
jgi:hypothetical protein